MHMTSESDREATESQELLRSLIEQILVQNNDVSRRLNDMELRSLRVDRASTLQTSTADLDDGSTIRLVSGVQRSSNQSLEKEGPRNLAFEAALDDSMVYRRVRRNECDVSYRTSVATSHGWSQLSGFSLAQISSISVIALPILPTDLANAQWYMPESWTVSSRAEGLISDTLGDQSSAHTKLPISLNLFKRKPETNNVGKFDALTSLKRLSRARTAKVLDDYPAEISYPEFISSTNHQAYNAPKILSPDRPKSPLPA